MIDTRKLYLAGLLVGWATLTLGVGASEAGERKLLNRSVYIPLEINTCKHLTNTVLYQGDMAVAVLPAVRTFQFTYYPKLERMAPDYVKLRVEGTDEITGQPFVAKLAVAPDGIYTSHRKVAFDLERPMEKLTYKIDTRYEQTNVHLECQTQCRKGSAPVVAAGAEPEGDPTRK